MLRRTRFRKVLVILLLRSPKRASRTRKFRQTLVGTLYYSIDLTKKSPGRSGRSHHVPRKNVSTGGKTSLTRERNNILGEIIFTPLFQDKDKIRVLEIHHGFQFNVVVNCLVDYIVLPIGG